MTASDNDLNSRPAALQGKTRVLVIDDDRKLCRLIRDYLQPMGYEVSAAHIGTDGVERALGEDWDAVILDIMLPGLDGFEVLKRIRRTSDVPVLMLTARGEEADRIVGLEMGADDYLPKTFSTRELLARLRAVLRRSMVTAAATEDRRSAPVTVGELYIDPAAHSACLRSEPLVLTRQEFDLLLALARAPDRV